MYRECSSCGTTEGVDAVCHHCGAFLCRDTVYCRHLVYDETLGTTAIHCQECQEKYHSGAANQAQAQRR
jgi:hypothetical protein